MLSYLAIQFPQWLTNWDMGVDNWIQSWRTPFLDTFFTIVTKLGDEGIVWIAIAVLFLCFNTGSVLPDTAFCRHPPRFADG